MTMLKPAIVNMNRQIQQIGLMSFSYFNAQLNVIITKVIQRINKTTLIEQIMVRVQISKQ